MAENRSYTLVSEEDVDVGQDLHHGVLEELAEEGCRQVHREAAVLLVGDLCNVHHGLRTHCQREGLQTGI